MMLTMLKTKIHRATVTHAELNYEGSIAIDGALMESAGIHPFEQIHAWNISNGLRFTTYALEAEKQSGMISVNGSAARSVQCGDLIIIAAFALVPNDEVREFKSRVVYVDAHNRISRHAVNTGSTLPA